MVARPAAESGTKDGERVLGDRSPQGNGGSEEPHYADAWSLKPEQMALGETAGWHGAGER